MKLSEKWLLAAILCSLGIVYGADAQAQENANLDSRMMRLRVMDTALDHFGGQASATRSTPVAEPVVISNPVPVVKPVYTNTSATPAATPTGIPPWAYGGLAVLIGSLGALLAWYRWQDQKGARKLAEAIKAQGISGSENLPKDWNGLQKLILSMEQEYSEACERSYALELKVSHQKDIIGKCTHERDVWMKKTQIAQDRWKKAERLLNLEREQRQLQDEKLKHELTAKDTAMSEAKSEFQKALGISAKQLHVEQKKTKHLEEQLRSLNERLAAQQDRHTQLTEKVKRLNAYNVTAAERLASEKEQRGQVAQQFEQACSERDEAKRKVKELVESIQSVKNELAQSKAEIESLQNQTEERASESVRAERDQAFHARDEANWFLGEERAQRADLEYQLAEERKLREHIQKQMLRFSVETVMESIPSTAPGSERRTQQRIEIPDSLSNKVKISAKDASGKFLRGKLKDVCPNGVRASLPASRLDQDSFGLKLSLPGRKRAISTQGTVKWRGNEENGLVDVGLALAELDSADQEHLETFLTS